MSNDANRSKSRMLSAADVEAAGPRLVLRAGDRLTPLARDRVRELNVEVVNEGTLAPSAAPPQSTATTQVPQAVPAPVSPSPAAEPSPAKGSGSGRALVLPPSGALYRRNALGPAGGQAPGRSVPGRRPKAGVVGAGHVGAMTALRLAESDLFDEVVLVDVVPGLAAGIALDIYHGSGLSGFSTRLSGSEDLAALEGADHIVITAGKPRQPGMSRTDLTAVNAQIMTAVAQGIRVHAPQATLVVVSNPLEEMTHLATQVTGFPDDRVLGMAGVLDSARFQALVALGTGCRPDEVEAMALGSHGPEMVIPLSQARVQGRPVSACLDAVTLSAVVERARDSGAEVVKLLRTGSAYFSPAESAAAMVRAMVSGSRSVLPVCVRSRGAYGTTDTRVGLPARLGPRGLAEIVVLPLRPDETSALQQAAARIAARIAELPAPSLN